MWMKLTKLKGLFQLCLESFYILFLFASLWMNLISIFSNLLLRRVFQTDPFRFCFRINFQGLGQLLTGSPMGCNCQVPKVSHEHWKYQKIWYQAVEALKHVLSYLSMNQLWFRLRHSIWPNRTTTSESFNFVNWLNGKYQNAVLTCSDKPKEFLKIIHRERIFKFQPFLKVGGELNHAPPLSCTHLCFARKTTWVFETVSLITFHGMHAYIYVIEPFLQLD